MRQTRDGSSKMDNVRAVKASIDRLIIHKKIVETMHFDV